MISAFTLTETLTDCELLNYAKKKRACPFLEYVGECRCLEFMRGVQAGCLPMRPARGRDTTIQGEYPGRGE